MKQFYSFLLLCAAMSCAVSNASAQMVGGNAFLQGAYLEIGVDNMGALGACNAPAGYHPHTTSFGTSVNLAEVYDYGHDGWTVGSPAYMGDYTIPGVPSEGWSIQIGATEYRNWATSTACTGTFLAPGTITGYSNTGGNKLGTWTGSAGGVSIVQEARVDTLASAVVFTVKIQNTNPTPTGTVYYERMCDPDNTSSWSITSVISGGPTTVNLIEHQNEDAQHHVVVSATGTTYSSGYVPLPYTYMAYGTKDCRAKAGILTSGLYPSSTPATLWGGTGIQTALGFTNQADVCIVLLYNLGSLAAAGSPGDRTVVSYAMFFNGASGIDSAFPNPQLVVNGTPMTSSPPPIIDRDTLNTCGLGLTTVPAILLNADDRNWSLSTWTWSPNIGLASTTGTSNTIDVTSIPNYTTYTITGTDSNTGMNSCLKKTFYLTIVTCGMYATANSPCAGDSLKFICHGDSTGATYAWSGPAPYTSVFSTVQSPVKYPSTIADAGMYRVIRTVGTTIDTAYVNVVINPIPAIGGVLGVCTTGTTSLTATPPGGTWSSSATGVASVGTSTGVVTAVSNGTTTISYTSAAGCKTNVVVTVDTLANITGTMVMCQGYSTTLHHPVAGGTWGTTATNVSVGASSGVVTGISGGTATITYHTTADCYKTAVVTVNPTPLPIMGTNEICQYFTTTLSDATAGGAWSSSNTAVGTISSAGVLYGVTGGTTTITYTSAAGCYTTRVATVHPKPAPPTVSPVSYCQFNIPVPVSAIGTNLTWYGPGVTAAYTLAATPSTTTPGVTAYYVTQTSAFGCKSDSSMLAVTVIAKPVPPVVHDTMFCQYSTPPALTADGSNLKWYTASGTPLASAPVPPTTFPGATVWQVSQTVNGCESDKISITVNIIFKPDFTIAASALKVCQFDSLTFRYSGPTLIDPTYVWDIPAGSTIISGSIYDTMITVRFDTATGQHVVYLTAANLGGRCATTVGASVKVIPRPAGFAHLSGDICIYDTISMALSSRTNNAFDFAWFVDDEPLFTTHKVNIITASSNHGGPYKITFNDTGRHIVKITSYTDANSGCPSQPTMDTVNVHGLPDPAFSIKQLRSKLCLEDSMWFEAAAIRYNNNYHWSPEQFFPINDAPGRWGKLNQERSSVMLTVTDPFGCKSSSIQDFTPETCCSVFMPTAFTPNGDGRNDHYGPVCAGFHRYHTFRVTNRWGQVLFESTNSDPFWDGTYNGVPQDMGVYFYYIKFDCGGKTVESKGDFTLVR